MLRDYSSTALSHISVLKSCLGDGVSGDGTCVGKGAVLRISLGNVMFFALMFLLTLGVTRKVKKASGTCVSHLKCSILLSLHKVSLVSELAAPCLTFPA